MGLSFLAIGLGALQVVLDAGRSMTGFGSHFITTFFVLSCVALTVFIWWELRQEHPVVDLRLLKNSNFALSVHSDAVGGFHLLRGDLPDTALLAGDARWTATTAGLCLSPSALIFIAVMPFMPILIRKITLRYMVIMGFHHPRLVMPVDGRLESAGTVLDGACQSMS